MRQQKKLRLWSRTVMFVLSDHSMGTTDRKVSLTERLVAAGIAREAFTIAANGGTDMVYLTDRTSPQRFDLLRRMREAALSDTSATGIDEALYREPNPQDGDQAHTLDGVHPDWHLAGDRTGDLVVTQLPGGAFTDRSTPLPAATEAQHRRQPVRHRRRVEGPGEERHPRRPTGIALRRHRDQPGQAENVDVAATAMRLLGLQPPRDNQGARSTRRSKAGSRHAAR